MDLEPHATSLRFMLNPVRNIDSSASNVNQMLRNGD